MEPTPPTDMPSERTLPFSIEAEQAVLGSILLHNEVHERIAELVEPHHFYEPIHSQIYERMIEHIRRGRSVSPALLAAAMGEHPALADIGGKSYFNALTVSAAEIVSPREYAQLVRDLALRRQLIELGGDVRETAYDGANDLSPEQQIERAETKLFELAERGRTERGFEPFRSALQQAIDRAERAYRKDDRVSGVASGFRDLDRQLGGFYPSDLIILAARPGMGKTALATNIAFNVARKFRRERDDAGAEYTAEGGVVGYFSLEMSAEQLAARVLAEQTEVPAHKMRRGEISENDFRKISAVMSDLERIPLYIDETGSISLSMLAGRARRLKRRRGLDLVVIDYLQLMTPSGRKRHDNRVQEVTEITQGLKALAKDLDVPIIALSQLSRAVESRDDKRPVLADLRESGSIEQDADVVMFIYRDEYYLKSREPDANSDDFMKWKQEADKAQGIAEILIEKHRHGPTGKITLQFNAEVTRFGDLERAGYEVR